MRQDTHSSCIELSLLSFSLVALIGCIPDREQISTTVPQGYGGAIAITSLTQSSDTRTWEEKAAGAMDFAEAVPESPSSKVTVAPVPPRKAIARKRFHRKSLASKHHNKGRRHATRKVLFDKLKLKRLALH